MSAVRATALLALLLTLAGCQPSAPPAPAAAAPTAWSYADEHASNEAAVREAEAALGRGSVVWPQWETLARAQLALAQLSGDYRLYTAAEQSLQRAFDLAGAGSGPFLARARYNYTVHRLPLVAADLDAAERESNPDRAAILGLRADLAFQRGDYPAALEGYRAALERREDLQGLVRLALWQGHMGHRSEALALLDRAERIYHGDSPLPRAWLALQRGLLALDRGEWDLALAHYQHALRLLPGWWLAREHIAEIHVFQGKIDLALEEYATVIRDSGQPEFMDASAHLLRERGDEAGAASWIARARALYEQRLAQLPEASYGHGLDHYLLFGTPAEALTLARRNHALRPNGEAQIKLINALLLAGEPREALTLARRALASGWRSAELHAAAARTCAANGLLDEARQQSQDARALNPHVARQYGLPADTR
ncbi:hypothetical protein ED208_13045 [Stagnimonas aquatica]|uniref:Tetratricopeptide repeat protein n=1 Tax=Stagnimonas aquatica TaxID=2689987 RepID=A0A3N0V7S3_9GAMM|nr:tetratricopeptide repeat protein [Stagnimonas aquatica]ROH88735.1 hypothetical protein ED208_13045 [Stagnimonas aquatica]